MSITKTGILTNNNFLELDLNLLKYDKNIIQEPDGTYWAHIFHHNDPATARFSNTHTYQEWITGVYESEDRWFDVGYTLLFPYYEFLVKQKTTSTATETRYRWIQNINPWYATYNDIKASEITKNTTTGYTNVSYAGGIYWLNGSTKMCIANASNGNWYGGIGAVNPYQGGIPGYPNSVVTTGSIDLYIKVYTNTKNQAQFIQELGINATEFYEY